jgi:hypothetical protein
VGTTTDAHVLIKKLQAAPGLKFGNNLYSVEFLPPNPTDDPKKFDKTLSNRQPFGIRYRSVLPLFPLSVSPCFVCVCV